MLIVASEEASYFLLLSASTLFAQFSTRKMIRQSFETVSSSMCGRSGWCGVWQLVVHRWFMCLSGLLLLWVEMVARLFSVSQIFSWCQGCEDCPDSGEGAVNEFGRFTSYFWLLSFPLVSSSTWVCSFGQISMVWVAAARAHMAKAMCLLQWRWISELLSQFLDYHLILRSLVDPVWPFFIFRCLFWFTTCWTKIIAVLLREE
ncbi:hypothetical protein Bca4012_098574 [Brassica carinata]